MKTFKFLNKKLTIKFEEAKETEGVGLKKVVEEDTKENFVARILTIIVLMFLISMIGKPIEFYKYKEGDIAKKDIASTIYTTFKDDIKKENVIKNLVSNSSKIYKRDENVEGEMVKNIDTFFMLLVKLNHKTTDEEITSLVKETGVTLSNEKMKKLISMKAISKEEVKNRIVTVIKALSARGIKEEDMYFLKKMINNIDSSLSDLERELITDFILPNEFYDEKATMESRREKAESVEDIIIKISPGDILIKKGSEITKTDINLLKQLGLYSSYYSMPLWIGMFIYFSVISFMFYLMGRKYIREEIVQNKYFYSTIIVVVGMLLLAKIIPLKMMYIYPFGALVLILGVIVNEKYALFMSCITLLFLFGSQGFEYIFLVLNIADILMGVYFTKKIKNRSDIVNAGIAMGIIKTLLILSMDMITKKDIIESIFNISQVVAAGVLAGMITVAVLPYLENTFNILTNIKLIELSDFSNPLLRELMLKAPGTFHHSILVSTLSENAAEAVGANSIFTRVAAYYHDIGKTKRPNFYVENQLSGVNPHETLNPYLSALVISSHTTDGEEMAKKYKIPKEIRDIMREHQGTTLLAYFYNKAKKENPDVNEMDFRYEGPKPQSKESAIIMLADSVEAAVRSINEKERNPITIDNMIRQIVKTKINDGQLSDAELTFKDIETVIQSFAKVFQGIYHIRLKYPELKKSVRKE